MGKWQDFPLPDGSYSDDSRPWAQQDVVNFLPTFAQAQGTRSQLKHEPVPGMELFAYIGDGPHRGARDVEGKLFVVSGNGLYLVAPDGLYSRIGTIPGTGPVCMTHNQVAAGNQVVIGNRDSGYLYNTATSEFSQITDDAFAGFVSVDFIGQYVVGVEGQRRYWYHSDLADASSYTTLDIYSAESSPDRVVGLIASHNEVLVFGERTIEPWVNQAAGSAAFQLNTGTVVEKGCANANTIRRLDNSVFFLGNDNIVYRLDGYTPVPVSTKPMAAAFQDLDPAKAFAFTYEDNGYVIYYLTWQDGQTWGYDVTSQKWHRRESFGLDRWRVNTLTKWNGDWYAGDYNSGRMYRLKWKFALEGCELMPRTITTGVLHDNGNRVFIHGFKLLADTGQPESECSSIACGTTTVYDGGPAFPAVTEVSLGSNTGYLDFRFATGGVPDKAEVWIGDTLVLDTGYWGDPSKQALLDAALTALDLPTETIQAIPTPASSAYVQWDANEAEAFTIAKASGQTQATVKIFAPLDNTAWKFSLSCPSNTPPVTLSVTGDVPNGLLGDSPSGTYTGHGGATPYASFAVTSGAFPPGLTLAADGSYSGTYTTNGSYAWDVTVTDHLGRTATVADTATVGPITMLLTGSGDLGSTPAAAYCTGADPATWQTIPIAEMGVKSGLPAYCGGWTILADADAAYSADLLDWSLGTTVTGGEGPNAQASDGSRLGVLGNGNGVTRTCRITIDSGANWTQGGDTPTSAGENIGCLAYGEGRWLTFVRQSEGAFLYDRPAYSEDGCAAWSPGVSTGGYGPLAEAGLGYGNGVFAGGFQPYTGIATDSADIRISATKGDSWVSKQTAASRLTAIKYGGGKWVATDYSGNVYVSADNFGTMTTHAAAIPAKTVGRSDLVFTGLYWVTLRNNELYYASKDDLATWLGPITPDVGELVGLAVSA